MESKQFLQTDLAWAAGIIDGEGYIGLVRQNKRLYRTIIAVQMTSPLVPKKMYELFGGYIGGPYFRGQATKKGVWVWSCDKTSISYNVAKLILPYLVEKPDQAKLLITYCETRDTMKKTFVNNDDVARLVVIAEELKSKHAGALKC